MVIPSYWARESEVGWKEGDAIYRFIYERAKIEHQKGITKVYPVDFDPYPGCSLKRDLEEKIENHANCKNAGRI